MHPFRAEPPGCIANYREYYPPLGLIITPAEPLHAMSRWDNQEGRNPSRKMGQEVNKSWEPSLPLPQSGLLSHCNSFVFHLSPPSWVRRWKPRIRLVGNGYSQCGW